MYRIDQLAGVLVALASPLERDGSVDEPAIDRLVSHVLTGGVHGLLALGSTGETAALDQPARRQVLRAVIAAADGRVPVMCGVAQSTVAAARAEVRAASDLGADAVLVAPPFYYPMTQAGVLEFFRRIAEASPLPVFVYNIPQFTKVVIESATVSTLAREGSIAGIKDSSRDFEYFEGVRIATRDLQAFRLFTGSDTMLLASLAVGGAGTICGAGNVAPHWVVRIYEEFQAGDMTAARSSQDRLYKLVMALREGAFPLDIKAALDALGVCEPWSAPPVQALPEPAREKLRTRLAEWGLLQEAGFVRS
ncbi:MAG TPA: dihydrodipicolinate synthase family protein [Candidatus Dormibacteraeota bacterium]|nr:dihydrodipicolinate synthase family protein [Candidatus Dormibacteraeota bacterium]